MLELVKNPYLKEEKTVRLLAAVMFADIAGYTSLMQEDEERAILLRNRQRRILEDKLIRFHGEIRQYYGDGALCIFRSAVEAVRCAVELQQEFGKEPAVPVRIGIHMGDIVSDSQGIYGDAVNITARIESLSLPGGILISGKIYEEIRNHKSIDATRLGAFELKNVDQSVEIFAVCHAGFLHRLTAFSFDGDQGTRPDNSLIFEPAFQYQNQYPNRKNDRGRYYYG